MIVQCNESIHGTQPYLAIKTKEGKYFWNNFDFLSKNKWSFTFDNNNIELSNIKAIGIAANSCYGKTEIIKYIFKKNYIKEKFKLN